MPIAVEPKLECPSVLLVDLHAEDVELVCRVRSHPGVEHVVWSWSTGDGVSVFLHPGDVDGHYESVVKEGEVSCGVYTRIGTLSRCVDPDATLSARCVQYSYTVRTRIGLPPRCFIVGTVLNSIRHCSADQASSHSLGTSTLPYV